MQAAISADGSLLAVAPGTGAIDLVGVKTLRRVRSLNARGSIFAVDPKGQRIITVGSGRMCLWDTRTGRITNEMSVPQDADCVALSCDGRMVACGDDASIRVMRMPALTLQDTVARVGSRGPDTLAFSPDGRLLIYDEAGVDRSPRLIRLLDTRARRIVGSFPCAVPSFALSPDGRMLATIEADGSVHVRNVLTGRQLAWRPDWGSTGYPSALSFSPDGSKLASGGSGYRERRRWFFFTPTRRANRSVGGVVMITDVHTGRLLCKKRVDARQAVRSIAFGPHGESLLITTAGYGGRAMLWRIY